MMPAYFEIFDENLVERFHSFQENFNKKEDKDLYKASVNILAAIINDHQFLSTISEERVAFIANQVEFNRAPDEKTGLLSVRLDSKIDPDTIGEFCAGVYRLTKTKSLISLSKAAYTSKKHYYNQTASYNNLLPLAKKDQVSPDMSFLGKRKAYSCKSTDVGMIVQELSNFSDSENNKEKKHDRLTDFLVASGIFPDKGGSDEYDGSIANKAAELVDFVDFLPENGVGFHVNMTALAFRGINEDYGSIFRLYRDVEWGLRSQAFSENFQTIKGNPIKPVVKDKKIEDLSYYLIEDDLDRNKAAKLYALTKELWFFAENAHMLCAGADLILQNRSVYDGARKFYQELGLLDSSDHNTDVLEFSKCIGLYTNDEKTDTSLCLASSKTKDKKVSALVEALPETKKFKKNFSLVT